MMLRKILQCACAINGTNPEKGKGKETQNKKTVPVPILESLYSLLWSLMPGSQSTSNSDDSLISLAALVSSPQFPYL